jgi:16S rRNA processing protein RimM
MLGRSSRRRRGAGIADGSHSVFVEVGRVARTHGLAGEVSLVLTADVAPERLCGLSVWFVPPPECVRESRVDAVRPGPQGPLVAFRGVADVATASLLRGCTVLASANDLPEVEEAEDLIGFRVVDAHRGDIGEVTDLIATGANDVWVVVGQFGEVLVPVIDPVVDEVDEESKVIRVHLLPGLLNDE